MPIRWRPRLADDQGLTLVELLVVTVLFGVIVAAVTTLFVQATNAETDLNNRFQAQLSARLALDRLRREVHCASSVTPAGPASSITLTLPTYCKAGTGTSKWCTVGFNGSTTRFRLWRSAADPCGDANPTVVPEVRQEPERGQRGVESAGDMTLAQDEAIALRPDGRGETGRELGSGEARAQDRGDARAGRPAWDGRAARPAAGEG